MEAVVVNIVTPDWRDMGLRVQLSSVAPDAAVEVGVEKREMVDSGEGWASEEEDALVRLSGSYGSCKRRRFGDGPSKEKVARRPRTASFIRAAACAGPPPRASGLVLSVLPSAQCSQYSSPSTFVRPQLVSTPEHQTPARCLIGRPWSSIPSSSSPGLQSASYYSHRLLCSS